MRTIERIHFRYIDMPCCHTQLRWVNSRLPNYCPECGTKIYPKVREGVIYEDTGASFSYDQIKPAPWKQLFAGS